LAQHPTFLEELMAAGRGVFALLTGNRRAAGYFDISQRGLVTSFIALVLAATIRSFLPILVARDHDSALVSLIQFVILFGVQLGFTVIVLRQIKRMDALIPYLVADNWVTFFVTLIFGALLAAGIGGEGTAGEGLTIILGISVLVLEVNIARIVMGLTPLQIASLIVAELVGALLAVGIIILIFPPPPEVMAQLSSIGQ
jgi:hypothetical protein